MRPPLSTLRNTAPEVMAALASQTCTASLGIELEHRRGCYDVLQPNNRLPTW
jgi:hypothetical protein